MDTKLVLLRGSEETDSTTTNRLLAILQGKAPNKPATIVEIRRNENTSFAITKYAPVPRCGVILFTNFTNGRVSLQFPVREIFGYDAVELEAADEVGSSVQLPVPADAPIGDHAYSAFCHEGMVFALGNSMPIIIINPKDDR